MLSHNSQELKENKMEKNKMKKLMFLTMIFGLMMVFTGSISAQQRPGRLENNCAGKRLKVGMKVVFRIIDSKKGTAEIFQREKPDGVNYGPWFRVCTPVNYLLSERFNNFSDSSLTVNYSKIGKLLALNN